MKLALMQAAAVAFVYVNLVHLVARWRRDNSVMDAAWGPGFVLLAWAGVASRGAPDPRQWLVAALVTVWGVRLAAHVALRSRGRGEDFRYRAWREAWGRWFHLRAYFQVFLLQGFFLVVVALPVVAVNARPGAPLGARDAAGALVWLAGFLFEAVGDYQLLRFKREPANRGRVMRGGVWRYTRHPNYFGEATLWWGVWLIALGAPAGAWSALGPLTLGWLLLRVSGVPLLEAHYAGRPDYEAYRRVTPAFIPWFPKGG